MGIILGVLVILMGGCAFSYLFNKKFEVALPVFILALISFMYIFGLFTILKIGVFVATGITVALFVWIIIDFIRKKKYLTQKLSISTIILFLLFIGFNIIFLWSAQVDAWDEFSHWATIVKRMFIYGNFGNLGNGVLFPGYPPATGIFHNFFLVLGNSYVESWLYISMNILNFSLIMPIFSQLKKGHFFRNILIVFFALTLPCIFEANYYACLYVDIYLGVLFAYILYSYFYDKKMSYFKLINISLAVFVLTASKAAGLGLSLIALLIIGLDVIFFQKRRLKKVVLNKRKYFLFLIPIISMLLSKTSWSLYLKIFNLSTAWETSNITFMSVMSYIFSPSHFEIQVTTAFISNLFAPVSYGLLSLSPVIWCLISLIIISFLMTRKNDSKRVVTMVIGLGVGFVVYAITLLILYLFTYIEYEAVNLASFHRYMSTYITALILLLFYSVVSFSELKLSSNDKNDNRLKNIVVAIIGCFAVSLVPLGAVINNVVFGTYTRGSFYVTNDSLNDFRDFCEILDEDKDRIYYLYADSSGITYYRAIYYALPIKVNLPLERGGCCWSLGKARYNGDIWSTDITVEEWENILIEGGYTYVYVHHTDEIFNETYKPLFENEEDITDYSRFKVEKNGSGVILKKI